MAGGIGSRFWPMSRSNYPKQFQDILGFGSTLLQSTFNRFSSFIPKSNIYIVTNERYADLVQAQLGDKITKDQVLLEPVGKNTAPCIAYATHKIMQKDPNAVFVVASADHLIKAEKAHQQNIELGIKACSEEDIVILLGIKATSPHTGYGYIQYETLESKQPYMKVRTFLEKPKLELAKSFLESGDFLWNSGIFLFSGKTILNAFEKYLPLMAEAFSEIKEFYYTEQEAVKIREVYATCQNISIDYGIMEKLDQVFVIPVTFDWSDLGTWGAVYEHAHKDYFENSVKGKVLPYDASGNVIQMSDKNKLLVVKGLENYIIVDTPDALLIFPKEDEQSIKDVVSDIKSMKNGERYL